MRAIFFTAAEPRDKKEPSAALISAALRLTGVELKMFTKPKPGKSDTQILADYRDEFTQYRPDFWITYGPSVPASDDLDVQLSAALGIPYVLMEPQLSRKRIDSIDTKDSSQILQSADAIITTRDAVAAALKTLVSRPERVTRLYPFVDTGPLVAAHRVRERHKAAMASHLRLPSMTPWLLTMGPMTFGGALDSYRMLARSFSRFPFLDWYLIVVGEGKAEGEVRQLLSGLPQQRVRLWSAVSPEDKTALLVSSDLFVWPALDDVGLQTLLEAQAAGLGAVACNAPEVNERVLEGTTGRLAAPNNTESFANLISFLLRQPSFRATYGKQARDVALADFDIHRVVPVLRRVLQGLKHD